MMISGGTDDDDGDDTMGDAAWGVTQEEPRPEKMKVRGRCRRSH